MTRVLITGGAGFLGSHLTHACLGLGWDVSILEKPEAGLEQVNDVSQQVKTYPVRAETAEVIRVMRQAQPDLVFHLASYFVAEHTSADVLNMVQSNITLGTQVLEAMAVTGVTFMVNAGSAWQHYQNQEYDPVNLYAATKQAFDDILEYYVQAGFMTAITLQLFDTYGPADMRKKLFNLLAASVDNSSILDMSPGEQMLDLVYIDDVVRAFLVAATRLLDRQVATHEQYAVSSGKPVSLRELVDRYQRVTGLTLNINWGGRPYRKREVMDPWSNGLQLPGWEPVVELDEGIKKTAGGEYD
jgi:nucleoside-diphosphate-sugar epimerase